MMDRVVMTISITTLLITFSLILFISTSSHADKQTVTLTNGEWAPYTSKKLKHYGVFSDIVSEAFALSGYQVNYVFLPWKRGYQSAKAGKHDGSVTWAPTTERKKDFYFSDPVTFNSKAFFHLKTNTFDWKNIDDLTHYKIGITRQYTYSESFDDAVKEGRIKAEVVDTDKQNILKLHTGRIDAFPMEIEVGYNLINQELGPEQASLITHHKTHVQETPIAVVISKEIGKERAQKLLNALNNGLKKLKASNRYENMLQASRKGEYRVNK